GSINDSIEVFEKLIRLAPDNEGYRTWIIGTRNYKRRRIIKFVYIAFMIWLLIEVVFGKQFQTPIALISTFLGLTLFGVWSTLEVSNFLIKRKYRRSQLPPTT